MESLALPLSLHTVMLPRLSVASVLHEKASRLLYENQNTTFELNTCDITKIFQVYQLNIIREIQFDYFLQLVR